MTTKQVARATEQSVAIPTVLDDSLLEVGTGLEDTASTDYAIPFLQILQAGSCLLYTSPSPRDDT